MKIRIYAALIAAILLAGCDSEKQTAVAAGGDICDAVSDTFSDYDQVVPQREIQQVKSEFYVLSYSWAPDFCVKQAKRDPASLRSGGRNHLQCGSAQSFGYILHGLWPQGTLQQPMHYPRACKGDQPKIAESVLRPYLCMTPSNWLLQHEYEYHGTCMQNAAQVTPEAYFSTAQRIHQQLHLPRAKQSTPERWLALNPLLPAGAVYEDGGEWRICLDTHLQFMRCPQANEATTAGESNCPVKGNISRKSQRHYYFLPSHREYAKVAIHLEQGERCFSSEDEAIAAGWQPAP